MFEGVIKQIKKSSILNLTTIDVNGQSLIAITLQLNKQFIENNTIKLYFKETEVILTKKPDSIIGAENIIPVKIDSIKKGDFFSEIKLSSSCGNFIVLLTDFSLNNIILSVDDNLFAVIKANEISLGIN